MSQTTIPQRFIDAVTKLYTAYKNNEINSFKASNCPVGIICNGEWHWENLFCTIYNEDLNKAIHLNAIEEGKIIGIRGGLFAIIFGDGPEVLSITEGQNKTEMIARRESAKEIIKKTGYSAEFLRTLEENYMGIAPLNIIFSDKDEPTKHKKLINSALKSTIGLLCFQDDMPNKHYTELFNIDEEGNLINELSFIEE